MMKILKAFKTQAALLLLSLCANQALAQGTKTIPIGWEAGTMYQDGASFYQPVNRSIIIIGYDITVSMYPKDPFYFDQNGNMLSTGLNSTALCWITAGPSSDSDLGQGWSDPPVGGGMQLHGSMKGGNYLMRTILKSNDDKVVITNPKANNLAIFVPAGSVISSHIDVAGTDQCDCEIQGVIFYQ